MDKAKEELAIFGGEKKVKLPPNEKWVKVTEAVKNTVLNLMDNQIVRIADGTGIIAEFESNFANMVGTRYALAMNCGTASLHSAYFAVGVGPGDEVIVPTYTWHATITPIIHCAAMPVFCDIDANSLTADPNDIERKITSNTKAICVVHVWGNVCDMDRIMDIADHHNIAVIEDCSHAHGAAWKGRKVGSFGKVGCFSMHGEKAVSGGECGVATTDDPEMFDYMVLLGLFGRKKIGVNKTINEIGDMSLGVKYRAHPWAIAMANEDLKRLDELNSARTKNYEFINDRLRNCPGIEVIDAIPEASRGGYLNYKFKLTNEVIKIADRNRIVAAMVAEGVPVEACRYTTFPWGAGLLHTVPLFTGFDRRLLGGCFYDHTLKAEEEAKHYQVSSLPVAEDVLKRLISMHAYADVSKESLIDICKGIYKVMENVEKLVQ